MKSDATAKTTGQRSAEELCALGHCYFEGRYVPQSYEQAVVWYQKAARRGLADAQYCLGVCYERGSGVPKSYKQAVAWYKKAAAQGFADAQYRLAFCYDHGNGVRRSQSRALSCYLQAAKQLFDYDYHDFDYHEFVHVAPDKCRERIPASFSKSGFWYRHAVADRRRLAAALNPDLDIEADEDLSEKEWDEAEWKWNEISKSIKWEI